MTASLWHHIGVTLRRAYPGDPDIQILARIALDVAACRIPEVLPGPIMRAIATYYQRAKR